MRRLVRDHNQDLHLELHRRVAEDFRERALSDPDAWARWTQEELYHRLHADPQDGAQRVFERLHECSSAGDLDALLERSAEPRVQLRRAVAR